MEDSTWYGPATWPMLRAEAKKTGRIRVLSVDRKTGALVVETLAPLQWANYEMGMGVVLQ